MEKQKIKEWVRAGYMDRHHDLARERGGTSDPVNIIWLDRRHHDAFHFLFGNRTLLEAARLLIRLHRWKRRNNVLSMSNLWHADE